MFWMRNKENKFPIHTLILRHAIWTQIRVHSQGQIQDFLIGGSNLQTGFDLLILLDNLLFFPDFSENSP